jgi:hypothetical protein
MGRLEDRPRAFLETGEDRRRQSLEGRLFYGEELGDLALGGAVNAEVSDGLFPVRQGQIQLRQGGELAASQSVFFDRGDAIFDFPFVLRDPR